MNEELREVAGHDWTTAVESALAEGYRWFDFLDCVDEIGRADEFRLVLRLVDREQSGLPGITVQTSVSRAAPELPTLRHLIAGASWHEREIAEMFGVTFVGGDPANLLLRPGFGGHPLRKDDVLGARAVRPWPGAKEPGGEAAAGRRRMVPPGVPEPSVWGERDPDVPPASSEEIAASTAGGRVRRRR